MFQEGDVVKIVKPSSSNYGLSAQVERINNTSRDGFVARSYLVSINNPNYELKELRTYYDFDLELLRVSSAEPELEFDPPGGEVASGNGFDALDSFVNIGSEEVKNQDTDEEFEVDVEVNVPVEPLEKLVEALDFIGNALVSFGNDMKVAAEKFKTFKESVSEQNQEPDNSLDNFLS